MSIDERNKTLDPYHIAQAIYDADSNSNRVKMVDAEMQIELSAEDGDSVLCLPDCQHFSKLNMTTGTEVVEEFNCQKYTHFQIYIEKVENLDPNISYTASLKVKPSDASENYFDGGSITFSNSDMQKSFKFECLAKTAKLILSSELTQGKINVFLVCKSVK